MMRFGAIVAGLVFAVLAAGPASANTIANFELSGVTFDDGGTASGTFSLDLTAHTVQSAAITTSANGLPFVGGNYDGSFFDSFTAAPTAEVNLGGLIIPFIAGQLLSLNFSFTDATDLSSLPSFIATGGESAFFILCGGLCDTRAIVAGTIDTVSVVSTTPIPATLPLLATALGGLGVAGWRRKRQAA